MTRRYIVLAAMLLLARATSAQSLDDPDHLRKLTAEKSAVIVRIRAKLKLNMAGPERSVERDLPGVVLDRTGLILCESSPLVSAQGPLTLTLQSIQVRSEAVAAPLDADLVYEDEDLGLAFLKLRTPPAKVLPSLDLTASTPLPAIDGHRVGHTVITVSRLGDAYGRAPLFHLTRINGFLDEPRPCWSVLDPGGDLALPVWSSQGSLIGFNVVLARKTEGGQGPANPFAALLGRRSQGRHVILPVKDIMALMGKARSKNLPEKGEHDPEHAPGKEPHDHDHR